MIFLFKVLALLYIDENLRLIDFVFETWKILSTLYVSSRSGNRDSLVTKSGKTKSGVTAKYSKLESYQDEENEKFVGKTFQEQEQLLKYQDEQVSLLANLYL